MKAERGRRAWSQAELSDRLRAKGLEHMLPSTVAKIENGDRAVRIDEANAVADIFGISVDELLGRSPAGGNLVWSASRLTGLARNSAGHMSDLIETVTDELQDVRYYAAFDPPTDSVDDLIVSTEAVLSALEEARRTLDTLGEASIPGVTITTTKRKGTKR
ncbi:hypothetical protein A5706_22960 [Mycobacterium sp. E796]|nr:hypothetical protein A5706_22960 [Mycobacterium sp. E796]